MSAAKRKAAATAKAKKEKKPRASEVDQLTSVKIKVLSGPTLFEGRKATCTIWVGAREPNRHQATIKYVDHHTEAPVEVEASQVKIVKVFKKLDRVIVQIHLSAPEERFIEITNTIGDLGALKMVELVGK